VTALYILAGIGAAVVAAIVFVSAVVYVAWVAEREHAAEREKWDD